MAMIGDPSDKSLQEDFFARGAEVVAPELVGCFLVRRRGSGVVKSKIIETEAYIGPHDLACHASRGRTTRTEPMFGPPGTLYIYLIYGLHWMLNVVTGPTDYPAAVLIRSTAEVEGPGRLTRAFNINGALNGLPAEKRTGLWFANRLEELARSDIARTPRIGVAYAGPIWAAKEYRFLLKRKA